VIEEKTRKTSLSRMVSKSFMKDLTQMSSKAPETQYNVETCPNRRRSLIAVHGLGADPRFAWIRKAESKERKSVNWLSDLLPQRIPNTRIMTFNYPSRWHRDAPRQRLALCASDLLDAVHNQRRLV